MLRSEEVKKQFMKEVTLELNLERWDVPPNRQKGERILEERFLQKPRNNHNAKPEACNSRGQGLGLADLKLVEQRGFTEWWGSGHQGQTSKVAERCTYMALQTTCESEVYHLLAVGPQTSNLASVNNCDKGDSPSWLFWTWKWDLQYLAQIKHSGMVRPYFPCFSEGKGRCWGTLPRGIT